MAGETDQIKAETKALVEAIRKRAQSEIENAQTITKDAYLNAIRSAREAVEQNQLLDPKRIEHLVEMIQRDAQENSQKTVISSTVFCDRLSVIFYTVNQVAIALQENTVNSYWDSSLIYLNYGQNNFKCCT
ncbi:MAG: hypothetical protein QNJ70_14320 [Xenococcaceae cyanobacterium MO_207.B15]|nr:hypothetical protein [Xenococcaceae cyanobacterium MO_207.B15]MDJ0745421.1 hypothetical protein [Xenococcaceae cyanobacterium MO_167.B27]